MGRIVDIFTKKTTIIRNKIKTAFKTILEIIKGINAGQDMSDFFFKNIAFSLDGRKSVSHVLDNTNNTPVAASILQNIASTSNNLNESIDFANADSSFYDFEDLAADTVSVSGTTVTLDTGTWNAKIKVGVLAVINGTASTVVEVTDTTHFEIGDNLGTLNNVAWQCYGLKLLNNQLKISADDAYVMPEDAKIVLDFNGDTANKGFGSISTPITGTTYSFVAGQFGNAIQTNTASTNAYIQTAVDSNLNVLSGDNDFTIEFWAKGPGDTIGGTILTLHTADQARYLKIQISGTGVQFVYNTLGGSATRAQTFSAINQSTYTHIAFVCHGGVLSAIQNGVKLAEWDDSTITTFGADPRLTLFVAPTLSGDWGRIAMDDLIISNVARYPAGSFSNGQTVFTLPTQEYNGVLAVPTNNWYFVDTEYIATGIFWNELNSISVTSVEDANVTVKYAVKFGSDYKVWNATQWDTITQANIATSGMTKAELQALTSVELNGTGGFDNSQAGTIAISVGVIATTATSFSISKFSINYDLLAEKYLVHDNTIEVRLEDGYNRLEIYNNTDEAKSGNVILK